MFGKGILTGLSVTLKHFFDSYRADRRRGLGHRYLPTGGEHTGPVPGFVTVQYPEEKLTVPQNFRFFPMLIKDDVTGEDWCTACGICARVCPPQCIWIVRASKADGKPEPKPEEFYIDTSICMQCSYCVEYCPFDAIKMDHNYELSTQERWNSWIFDKDRLTVPNSYYTELHPRDAAAEKAVRDEKESKKKAGGRASKAAGAAAAVPGAAPAAVEAPKPVAVAAPVAVKAPVSTRPQDARANVRDAKAVLAGIGAPPKSATKPPADIPPAKPAEAGGPSATSASVHEVVVTKPAQNMPAPATAQTDNPAPAKPEVGPTAAGAAPAEAKKPKRTPEELAALKAANAARRAELDKKQ